MKLLFLQLYMAWKSRRQQSYSPLMPYRFECPECFYFKVNSSDEIVLGGLIQDHMRTFHGR